MRQPDVECAWRWSWLLLVSLFNGEGELLATRYMVSASHHARVMHVAKCSDPYDAAGAGCLRVYGAPVRYVDRRINTILPNDQLECAGSCTR